MLAVEINDYESAYQPSAEEIAAEGRTKTQDAKAVKRMDKAQTVAQAILAARRSVYIFGLTFLSKDRTKYYEYMRGSGPNKPKMEVWRPSTEVLSPSEIILPNGWSPTDERVMLDPGLPVRHLGHGMFEF